LAEEPRTSFAAAAKHLFRHLHDARTLRKNPLVRGYFASGDGAASKTRDATTLARIHADVRRAAEQCRDADFAEGHDERAMRQYAIVTLQCIERRPIAEVAAALGISHAHCYRERAAICRRVARHIAEHEDVPALEPFPTVDEFRFLADQTTHRLEFGDESTLLRQCDELVRGAPSPQEKIEALRLSATIASGFGNLGTTRAAYAAAQAIWTEHLDPQPSAAREIARGCIDLIALELALHAGDGPALLRTAQGATSALEPFAGTAPMRVRELYAESLFNLGLAVANLGGNFEEGFDHVAKAEELFERIRPVSAPLRSRVMVEAWRGRNRLLMSSRHWLPAWQREQGITRAFEYAYSAGAFAGAIRALVALTEHHAFARNDAEALRAGRSVVALAKKHPSRKILGHNSITAVLPLLSTQYWAEGTALLPDRAKVDEMDSYDRDAYAYCMAVRALRLHEFQNALTLATSGSGSYPSITVRMRLVAAAAAHALEREREARRLIEEGVAVAEEQRSAPILKDAYSLASEIVRDSRFKGQAREIARLLSA
jgi:hypothetical protein